MRADAVKARVAPSMTVALSGAITTAVPVAFVSGEAMMTAALSLASVDALARTWYLPEDLPAVKTPSLVIVPPVADQLTLVDEPFLPVERAAKDWVAPGLRTAVSGERENLLTCPRPERARPSSFCWAVAPSLGDNSCSLPPLQPTSNRAVPTSAEARQGSERLAVIRA